MRHAADSPVQNSLLAALPAREYRRLAPHIEPVTLTLGQVLIEPGSRIRHLYFPYSGVISLLTVVDAHKAAEVAVVGNEGVVGGSAMLGINVSHQRAISLNGVGLPVSWVQNQAG